MNGVKLEFVKFIRSKIIVILLAIFVCLIGTLFYINNLDYKVSDDYYKNYLLQNKITLSNYLDPKSVMKLPEEKKKIVRTALENVEATITFKYRNDNVKFIENNIAFCDRIIDLIYNDVDVPTSKANVEYQKERLMNISKIGAQYQYEDAPQDGYLFQYKFLKYNLFIIFLISISYFGYSIWSDYKFHKGFLFTTPFDKKSFVLGKTIISIGLNISLIILQLISILGVSKYLGWKNTPKYPVYIEMKKEFVEVMKMIKIYVGVEIILMVVVISIISTILIKILNKKTN